MIIKPRIKEFICLTSDPEGCIEQMGRLFFTELKRKKEWTEGDCIIRLDDLELREDVQKEVIAAWGEINTENKDQFADLDGYWNDFYKIYGFNYMIYKK